MNLLNSSILDEGVVGDVVAVLDSGRTMVVVVVVVVVVVEGKIITTRATLAAGT
jgi:hypothetical protein